MQYFNMILQKYGPVAPGLALLLALCLSACAPDRRAASPKPPNIVFFFSDELQMEDIGCYGGAYPTPNIDRLAAEGMRFTQAFTVASMCTPSRYALLSGQYPGRCTHPDFRKDNPVSQPYNIAWNTFFDSTAMTLPRMLAQQGYFTGMAGKWHLGPHLEEASQSIAGLRNLDSPEADERLSRHQAEVASRVQTDAGYEAANSVMYSNFDGFPVPALQYHHFPWMTAGAMEFLEKAESAGRPFFLMLTPTALHGPHHGAGLTRDYAYTPEGRRPEVAAYNLDVEKLSDRIDALPSPRAHRQAGLAFLDHQVGLVLKQLEAMGVEEETLVVFVPDHNTEPGKATCYEKGIHIPMIVRWPGRVPAGSETDARVQLTDWMATLSEITGAGRSTADSRSFLRVLNNPEAEGRTYTFASAGYTRSVSDGRFKYIALRYPDTLLHQMASGDLGYAPNYLGRYRQGQSIIAAKFYPGYFQADQLYDLESDPHEQYNLAGQPAYAEQLQSLREVLGAHLATFDHPFSLDCQKFMSNSAFKRLTAVTRQLEPESIEWYKRDWGQIEWPPPVQH